MRLIELVRLTEITRGSVDDIHKLLKKQDFLEQMCQYSKIECVRCGHLFSSHINNDPTDFGCRKFLKLGGAFSISRCSCSKMAPDNLDYIEQETEIRKCL
jgi:hypothetical protein